MVQVKISFGSQQTRQDTVFAPPAADQTKSYAHNLWYNDRNTGPAVTAKKRLSCCHNQTYNNLRVLASCKDLLTLKTWAYKGGSSEPRKKYISTLIAGPKGNTFTERYRSHTCQAETANTDASPTARASCPQGPHTS